MASLSFIAPPAAPTPLDVARAFTAAGIPVFPCREEDTEDLDTSTGEFLLRPEKSPYTSNGLKAATRSERIINILFGERHPNALIGVPTGESLGAWVLDLDRHGERDGHLWLVEMEAAHGPLPETARASTANSGTHVFFRHVEGIRNKAAIAPGVDCRGQDGYVIGAGSVMTDGRAYQWVDRDGNPSADQLAVPPFADAPQWLLEILKSEQTPASVVIQHTQYQAPRNADPYVNAALEGEINTLLATGSGGRGDQLNRSAFSLGQIVAAGALNYDTVADALYSACVSNGLVATDGDKKVRSNIKRSLADGGRQKREIPESDYISDNDNTRVINTDHLIINDRKKRLGEVISQPKPAVVAIQSASAPEPKMAGNPYSPEAAGGILCDVSKWITETSIIPVPELSMAASICLLGGAFGGKALGPTNSGVNIFATVVMATAGGKGHAPKAIRSISDQMGNAGAVTNGDPTSYAALERMLRNSPSTAVVMDEFGVTLQDVNGRNASSASASIRRFLLTIYDQSNSVFDGRVYASSESKKDESPIKGPALSILGMTTPETLFAGLSESSITDGFMNRFLFITAAPSTHISPPRLGAAPGAPTHLIDKLKDAITGFPEYKGNMKASIHKHKIPFSGGDAGEAYARWCEIFMWQHRSGDDPIRQAIIGRAAENALRLATIRSISTYPANPEVSLEDVEWGWAITYASLTSMLDGIKRMMSDSPAEALRNAIKEAIRQSRDGVIAYSHLLQRKGVSKADNRQVEDALKWLVSTGEVVDIANKKVIGKGSKLTTGVQPLSQQAETEAA